MLTNFDARVIPGVRVCLICQQPKGLLVSFN